jgi:3-methyladenine DNA glycosylase Mpg
MGTQDLVTVTEALQKLSPAAHTAEQAYGAVFREIADLLLNQTTLYIAQRPYRVTELEFYWSGPAHIDPFSHGQAMQKQLGAWYFHRAGRQYRSGTYKGLDVAFGNREAFGGILLRSIEALAAPGRLPGALPGALIDGPCMVVDHILAITASPSIDALVSRFDVTIENTDRRSPLYLELAAGSGRNQTVYATPRIGLTLKKGTTEARQRYIARHYRFLSEPARIRKGKPHLITALHQQGRLPAEISALTGTRLSVLQGYLEAFEAGRTAPIEEFGGDLSTSELCRLLGACSRVESS